MIAHYGYVDASGEYFIVINTDKCDRCGDCVKQCPQAVLEIRTELVDLEDRSVVAVTDEQVRKIKYTCAPCKPETGWTPCVQSCKPGAVSIVWRPAGGGPENSI